MYPEEQYLQKQKSGSKVYRPLILVVDDQATNLQVIANILKRKKYRMNFALNGREALEIARNTPPDLVLLDVMMPEMDGFETAREFNNDENLREIPIIFITAKNETEDLVKGLSTGAVDYITKPFFSEELLIRVKNHLDLKFSREELKQTNAHIRAQNERLKQLYEEKKQFIATASHDLKNPLNAITGLALILIQDMTHEKSSPLPSLSDTNKLSYLELIKSSGEHLTAIIGDILAAENLDSTQAKRPKEMLDLSQIVRKLVELNKFNAAKKGISINFYADDAVLVEVEPVQVRELFDNLISNAVKYSPKNSRVNISVKALITDATQYSASVSIEDQGPGFTEEDKKKIFRPFQKLSAKPTGNESSTGLGLSIVKKITDNHKGKVILKTEPGQGSEFTILLP